MLIQFNVPRTRVLFHSQGGSEYKNMMGFPAFIKEGPFFYVVAKPQVVYSVVNRLRKAFKNISIDKEVLEFMNEPMVLKQLPDGFKYITTPMNFQDIALRYLYTVGSGGLLLEPGMGKSKVTLDYISLMKFKKSLILVPLPLLSVWQDEVQTHRPDLTIHLVKSTDWAAEWDLGKNKDIICMNYSKASICKDELLSCKFDFIHVDEFLIKDPSTTRTKDITKIAGGIPYRCGGSGTLINNSVLDVFAPVRYLEPSLVGYNFSNFKDRHTVRNIKDPRQIVAYAKSDEAKSILESCCIVMTKDEWLTLPKKHFHDVCVQLSDSQRNFYRGLSSNYVAQLGSETIKVDNALVMMAKLYQVSNGFVYVTDVIDEDSEEVVDMMAEVAKKKKKSPRRTVFFEEQPKVLALKSLLKKECKGKRGIIWYNLSGELELIRNALVEEGHKFVHIGGGDSSIGEKIRMFNTDPSYTWLIGQAKSINYGVTILGTTLEKMEASDIQAVPSISPEVCTEIFYSCNFSLEVYLQQQDRVHRLGQKHECHYYRIFTNTDVEMRIRKALDEKMTIRKEMLVDIAETLRTTGILGEVV